jgi:hypothetical protein
MPISFPSKSHGQIPIGFFNIETDMLLMDRYFFFSTDFCEWIVFHQDSPTIDFGVYTFSAEVFRGIIGYIEAGGMPGWLNGRPPDYVTRTMAKLAITHHKHFGK